MLHEDKLVHTYASPLHNAHPLPTPAAARAAEFAAPELSPVAAADMLLSSPMTSQLLSSEPRLGAAALPLEEMVRSIEGRF